MTAPAPPNNLAGMTWSKLLDAFENQALDRGESYSDRTYIDDERFKKRDAIRAEIDARIAHAIASLECHIGLDDCAKCRIALSRLKGSAP